MTNEMHKAFVAYYQCRPPTHKPVPKPVRPGMLPPPISNSSSSSSTDPQESVVPRITIDHLRTMAELVDEKFSEYELAEMFMEADKDGDGEVTEQDFLRIMKRTVRL